MTRFIRRLNSAHQGWVVDPQVEDTPVNFCNDLCMCHEASDDSMNNIHFPPTSLFEAAVTSLPSLSHRCHQHHHQQWWFDITVIIIINITVITIVGGSSCQSCAVPSRLIKYSEAAACLIYLFHITPTITRCSSKAWKLGLVTELLPLVGN